MLALNTTVKTLAKYHVCNLSEIGEKTFQNILIGPGYLTELSRKVPQVSKHTTVKCVSFIFVAFLCGNHYMMARSI